MDSTELERAMRDLEYFHHLRCLPGAWIVLRLDGRGFSKLTVSQFDKPFDSRFRDVMYQTCKALLEELQGIYGYTESDEISLLFGRDWNLFDREKEGKTPAEAMAVLSGQAVAFKNELLFQRGINFNELPLWQRRGTGMYWETYEKAGYDPVRQVEVAAVRRRLKIDEALPMKEAHGAFIQAILEANS